jgi:hypothetical protein
LSDEEYTNREIWGAFKRDITASSIAPSASNPSDATPVAPNPMAPEAVAMPME